MIKNKIEKLITRIFHHNNEQLPSFLLHNLFHSGKFLPYTSSSLKMKHLSALLNNICIHRRSSILEFGSGISTILMARLMKLNKITGHIISIDENAEWQKVISSYLEEEGLIDFVMFVHAPAEKNSKTQNALGYNQEIVFAALNDRKFDLILIDGPSAWNQSNKMSRLTNFEFFENHLSDNFTIFLDNANRPGESALAQKIIAEFGIKPTKIDSTFIAFKKGQHFNFVI